jgi:hypothetical protein
MVAIPKSLRFLLFGMGPKFHGTMALVLEIIGLVFLILGMISGFRDETVGMWSTEWFLVTIALWIWALWSWLCAYTAAKE